MIDEAQIKEIIRRVTENVLGRMIAEGLYLPEQNGALVILPSFIPEPALLNSYLMTRFPTGVTCAMMESCAELDPSFDRILAAEKAQQQRLLSSLKFYQHVVLAMPSLQLLNRIANGEDSAFTEQIMLRAILQEKKVTVVLDYRPPKFRRGTFFESVVSSITTLKDMGVEIVSLVSTLKQTDSGCELVTEDEIMQAYLYGDRSIRCAKGAIVTPLAKDKANELGVVIEG
jgi:hypothetical protein